jgi:hypothetical protein
MVDEHLLHRLQVELRRQVHNGEVLVVEVAVLLGRVAVAAHEMLEHLPMRRHVAVEVHGHEAGELQEAGINVPPEAGIARRHLDDAVALEPLDAALLGELVDRGRRASGVDGAAHQGDGAGREGIALRLHAGDGRNHRNRGLADRENVQVRPKRAGHRHHVVDVVVEVEQPGRKRHHAGVHPIGNEDLVGWKESLDRAA